MPRILIIDDSILEVNQVSKEVTKWGHEIIVASCGADGMEKSRQSVPDIIILDLVLPDMTGYDICRMLRGQKETYRTPIILLTVKGTTEDKVVGFGCGANDYITKPYDMRELQARVEACLRVKEHLDRLTRDNEEMKAHLKTAENMAITDPVTGLFNRRYFHDVLSQEFLRSQRYGTIFSTMMLDLDCFKEINDSFGHDVGDYVLSELSKVVRSQVRDVDLLSRYGGDELAILLPQSSCSRAMQVAERILEAVRHCKLPRLVGWEKKITVSIGVAGLPNPNFYQGFQVLSAADLALIRAKRMGRNRVEIANEQDIQPIQPT